MALSTAACNGDPIERTELMKRLIVDLDGTLTLGGDGQTYETKEPNWPLVARLREYKADGFDIVIHTARNMRTHEGNVGRINVHTLPGILDWLKRHDIPHDEVLVGKPWCGFDGFYIDDRAVRPDEFIELDYETLRRKLRL
jgi:capsule biosynthesis phosphatase